MFDDFEKFLDQFNASSLKRRIPIVLYRKGGDRTDWTTPGSTIYAPTSTIVMVGAVAWTGGAALTGSVSQALPVAFYGEPLLFVQHRVTNPAGAFLMHYAQSAGDAVEIYWKSDVNITMARFAWLVLGGQLTTP